MTTILCIDDDPAILRALQRELSRHGQVLTAQGPAQALSVLAKESVTLVVCDFRMPGMDGLQLLHLLRKLYPQMVRVVLTANDIDPTEPAVAEADAFRFLTKPWNRRDLHATIERALEVSGKGSSVQQHLEAAYPGISEVAKTAGRIEIDPADADDKTQVPEWLR